MNQARGEATRFSAILEQYSKAPEVTRRRLYLESVKKMLGESKGIYVVDSEQRALVPWLSLDGDRLPQDGNNLPQMDREEKNQ